MSYLADGLKEAFSLLLTLDGELWAIVFRSLLVSGSAVILASLAAVPLGSYLAWAGDAWYIRVIKHLVNALMGLPPVVAGLFVYLVLTSQGLLGDWQVLFSVEAMIMAQVLLVFPVVLGLTISTVHSVDAGIADAARTLGASPWQQRWTVLREAQGSLAAAVAVGFGRALAEVGAVMMVGGNIAGRTRVMTTAIVLETRKGNFGLALGLGLILLAISLLVNVVISGFAPRRGVSQ